MTRLLFYNNNDKQVFLTKIVKRLAQDGLLEAHRGAYGDVRLARPAGDITLRQIIETIEGPVFLNYCLTQPGKCPRESTCPVRDVWLEAEQRLFETLESCSLAYLAERSKELCSKQSG